MRITFITTHFPPAKGYGGVCESSYGLVRALSNQGVYIDVITSDASLNGRIKVEQHKKLETEKLKIHPFRYSISKRNCFSLRLIPIIRECAQRADVIHVNGIFSFPVTVGALIAVYLDKPYLVSLHGGLLPATFRKKKQIKKLFFQSLIKKILFQSGCVHVTSDFEMAICKELGVMSPIALIPNGVDIDDLQKISPVSNKTYWQKRIQGHAYVLFLGRISQEKGVDLLIEAWHTVFRRFPDVLLVIAGPAFNRFGKRIIDKVSRSHTRDSIIFTGNVDGQFKAALLRNAEMLVLPSYSESFGNVVLEAMAFNIPIVASEGTPWKSIESIGCGFWVPAECEAISQAIIKMLSTSKQERALIGKKGHGFAKRCFQWDVVAKMYLNTYQQVMIR